MHALRCAGVCTLHTCRSGRRMLGVFHYSVSYCLETRSLAEEETSLLLGWPAREISRPVCTPNPWCWGCRHVQTCVAFYMDTRDINSCSHTCHTSQPTHWPSAEILNILKSCGLQSCFLWCYDLALDQQHAGSIHWVHISVYTFWKRWENWHCFLLRLRKLCTTNLFS